MEGLGGEFQLCSRSTLMAPHSSSLHLIFSPPRLRRGLSLGGLRGHGAERPGPVWNRLGLPEEGRGSGQKVPEEEEPSVPQETRTFRPSVYQRLVYFYSSKSYFSKREDKFRTSYSNYNCNTCLLMYLQNLFIYSCIYSCLRVFLYLSSSWSLAEAAFVRFVCMNHNNNT